MRLMRLCPKNPQGAGEETTGNGFAFPKSIEKQKTTSSSDLIFAEIDQFSIFQDWNNRSLIGCQAVLDVFVQV